MPSELESQQIDSWKTLDAYIADGDVGAALALLKGLDWEDQRRVVSRLPLGKREVLVELLGPEDSAELLCHLAEAQAVEILEEMPSDKAAAVVEEMPPETGGNLLRELDEEDAEAILAKIDDAGEGDKLRRRTEYAEGSAGSLMCGAPVWFQDSARVGEVLANLEEHAEDYSDRDVQYLYVTGAGERLVGVLRLRDLVLSKRDIPVSELMIRDPVTVTDTLPLAELEDVFQEKAYLGLPVVDAEGRLLGVVPRDTVQHESAEEQAEMFLQSSGIVSGEELRSMPMWARCRKRLAWLAPNIVLNLVAASVIAANEATLQEVIALAVFLPIVSDMSGCSGNQAVAVSIRELTLGLLRSGDFLRVVLKEGVLGVVNGLVLGVLLGAVAALWKGNVFLGLVVALSLVLNTVISVLLGGLVPLFLKRIKVDPALASGPILTTCTDMCGFFLVLTIASTMLDKLA